MNSPTFKQYYGLIIVMSMVTGAVFYFSFKSPAKPTLPPLRVTNAPQQIQPAPPESSDELPAKPVAAVPQAPAELVVYVSGAVMRPGVFKLSSGARINDAVQSAGGLAQNADPNAINLAERVSDGM